MVENQIIMEIIRELGPTGLLVAGLYLMAGRHATKITKHIETINDELGEIIQALHRIADNQNGKS